MIRDDRTVTPSFMTMQEAIDAGADAFFDEKYGETVRTVRVNGYSHELCGGTHCRATGQIGGFVITGERSIGSGMRRIEALTGAGADAWHDARVATLEAATEAAGAQSAEVLADRIRLLQDELRETKRRLKAGGGAGIPKPGELAARAEEVAPGVRLVSYAGPFESIDALKGAARDVARQLPSGVIALGLEADEPQVFVTVSDDLVGRGDRGRRSRPGAVGAIGGRGGAGRRWPRARAPGRGGRCGQRALRRPISGRAWSAGNARRSLSDGLLAPDPPARQRRVAGRLHRARHRDRVREGARVRDRR